MLQKIFSLEHMIFSFMWAGKKNLKRHKTESFNLISFLYVIIWFFKFSESATSLLSFQILWLAVRWMFNFCSKLGLLWENQNIESPACEELHSCVWQACKHWTQKCLRVLLNFTSLTHPITISTQQTRGSLSSQLRLFTCWA